ncbi:hypothetical protein [Sorangium sp. So ce145]|uniref:hypothetical protein n=1 Tax=Sorangium sp. So ce145 TaxID=3133285 RepID=UPI003F5E08F6
MNNASKRIWKISWMLPVLLMGTGCIAAADEQAGDEQADDETVATAEQAFSGYWSWSWADDSSTPPVYIGTDTDRTCFLSGVGGTLASRAGTWPDGDARVSVFRSGGGWYLDTHAGTGYNEIKGTAICVPSVANRTTPVRWSEGQPAQILAPVTTLRRCGLMSVLNEDAYGNDDNWKAAGDGVMIWNDGTNWYIGGTGHADGIGGCVDVTYNFIWNATWAPTTGTSTLNVLQQIDGGTNPLGTQCFLTGLGGRFWWSDWSDGVFINYDPGSHWWSVTVTDDKTAHVACVQ